MPLHGATINLNTIFILIFITAIPQTYPKSGYAVPFWPNVPKKKLWSTRYGNTVHGTWGYIWVHTIAVPKYPVLVHVPDPWVRVPMQHSLTKFPCPMETKTLINSKNKWIYWDFFFVLFFFWHFVHSNVESLSCVFYIVGCDMIQTIPLYLW